MPVKPSHKPDRLDLDYEAIAEDLCGTRRGRRRGRHAAFITATAMRTRKRTRVRSATPMSPARRSFSRALPRGCRICRSSPRRPPRTALTAQLSEAFILVDPVDGTREFLAGKGEFTVNIGLVVSGEPKVGVVYAPALEQIWMAGEKAVSFPIPPGAKLPPPDQRRPIHIRHPGPDGLVALTSWSHTDPRTTTFLAKLPVKERRMIGSSLKFCAIADGSADIYPRFGATMEWDTAAGDAILRAAGGIVLDRDGQPLRYGKAVEQIHERLFRRLGRPRPRCRPMLAQEWRNLPLTIVRKFGRRFADWSSMRSTSGDGHARIFASGDLRSKLALIAAAGSACRRGRMPASATAEDDSPANLRGDELIQRRPSLLRHDLARSSPRSLKPRPGAGAGRTAIFSARRRAAPSSAACVMAKA